MVTRSYMSRREVEQQSFSLAVAIFVPLGAVLLQVLLPREFHGLAILDLPFIVTLFFAISRRSPIAGTVTGAYIGLLQDVLTGQPIGVNGMAKSVIGYAGASLGSRIDVENTKTRALLAFGFSLLQSVLLYLIERRLLGIRAFHLMWLHELLRAAANTAVALPVFLLLDRAKRCRSFCCWTAPNTRSRGCPKPHLSNDKAVAKMGHPVQWLRWGTHKHTHRDKAAMNGAPGRVLQ
ncbi:MAG: rod shape-determining protein MreD [Acidobacteriaceae bacterium]